jgi:hypothetical protein
MGLLPVYPLGNGLASQLFVELTGSTSPGKDKGKDISFSYFSLSQFGNEFSRSKA